MNVEKLNIYLIILTIISLFLLFIFSYLYKPTEITVTKDLSNYLNKVVSISGNIKEITLKENNLFFNICDFSRCVKIVYFNPSKNSKDIINSAYANKKKINVTGKVELYNNEFEIILYKYKVV